MFISRFNSYAIPEWLRPQMLPLIADLTVYFFPRLTQAIWSIQPSLENFVQGLNMIPSISGTHYNRLSQFLSLSQLFVAGVCWRTPCISLRAFHTQQSLHLTHSTRFSCKRLRILSQQFFSELNWKSFTPRTLCGFTFSIVLKISKKEFMV